MNEWDEIEWSRLLELARHSEYEEIVEALKPRTLQETMEFLKMVDNLLGSIKMSNLISAIESSVINLVR